jgi:AraC-like DNA-binding protein
MNSLARLDQIVHRLTESEFLSLSADDLADRCRCDRRRVLQLFRQSFGISLRHQQGQLRKLRATQMLEQGANLNEVSKECGYDNADTFRAWFRRAFGTGLSRWLDGQPEPQKQDATESD